MDPGTAERIRRCLVELDGECVMESVDEALRQGVNATEIVLGPMSEAMKEIGRLYEDGEYFIAELIEAAEIFKDVMKRLEPLLRDEAAKTAVMGRRRLRIVIGTVKGDVHDIGKTLVKVMLQAAGHEVIDLGVDVDAERFVEAIEKHGAEVLGMSALLTSTASYMRKVIELLKRRGLRDKVYVIVGGAATSPEFAKRVGADAWARNAVEAVKILNRVARDLGGSS